jgi:phosphopantetheine adenylyltransferase
MTKVDVAFLIGRFQPFHNGHKHLIDYGLEYADKSGSRPSWREQQSSLIQKSLDI